MLERLAKLNEKYTEISASLEDPAVISDIEGYTKLLKEYKNLTPIIDEYRRYLAAVESEKEARAILDDSSAAELHELAQEEFTEAKATIEDSIGKLKILLLPRDPNDDKNVIVEIRAGTGGDEAALFAAVLFRMYSMYCDSCGFKISVANANETDRGGFKEITFSIEATAHTRDSSSNREFTAFSVFPRLNRRDASIPRRQPLPFFPRLTRSRSRSSPPTSSLNPASRAVRAVSISTRPNPPSV